MAPETQIRVIVTLILSTGFIARGDDQFTCCMSGLKQIRSVGLCQAPCCPGYEEVLETPPLLAPVVYCKMSKVVYKQYKKADLDLRDSIYRYFRG